MSHAALTVAAWRTRSAPSGAPSGTIANSRPRRAASASRRSGCVTGRSRPVSAISPNAHTGPSATPRAAEASASATARSAAGSSTRTPPATLTKTSCWPSARPLWRASTASSSDSRLRSNPLASRRGMASSLGATSACMSIVSGRVPSMATKVHEPGRSRSRAVVQAARVGDRDQPAVAHLEEPDLVGRAEAVLLRAQHAQRAQRVALEHQDDVDQVFEHARAGDDALLGHVADQHDADVPRLGEPLQPRRRLAHLRHRSGGGRELLVPERLDRVDDADLGRRGLDRRADRLELGLREHADALGGADALGAQPHLLGRLLARDEQHRALRADRAEHRGREARLADARLAAEQDERARDEAAAEHAVELGDARADARGGARLDRAERHDDRRAQRPSDALRCARRRTRAPARSASRRRRSRGSARTSGPARSRIRSTHRSFGREPSDQPG